MTQDEFEQLAADITRNLTDKRRVISTGWLGFERMCLPEDAPDIQRNEMCIAFFAGAQHLFSSIMTILDPGVDPTHADLGRMDAIHEELSEFAKHLTRAVPTRGRA